MWGGQGGQRFVSFFYEQFVYVMSINDGSHVDREHYCFVFFLLPSSSTRMEFIQFTCLIDFLFKRNKSGKGEGENNIKEHFCDLELMGMMCRN